MADIKIREMKKGTIKTLEKATVVSQKIKNISAKTKDMSQDTDSSENSSPTSYASNNVSRGIENASGTAFNKADLISKKAMTATRKNFIKIKAKRKAAVTSEHRQFAKKMARKSAVDSAKVSKKTGEIAARNMKKAAIATVRAIKFTIRSIRALVAAIIAGGWIAVIIIVICCLFGAALYFFGDESSQDYISVSPEVEAYTGMIQKYCDKYGISEYVELVKAVMMQESAGKGNDPMQASECSYNTKYPKSPNGITDPEYSISCGVQYLKVNLSAAKVKSPVDMDRIKLALQGYNFGAGYISWALGKYGGYSKAGAEEFAKQQAKAHGWSSYGDMDYVDHVLRYYPYGNYSYDVYNGSGKLGLPIKGMTRSNISSHFGPRSSPGGIGTTNHQGIDIAFPMGTHVLACESGTVTTAGWNGELGKCIIISHGKGLETVYGHLSKINVKKGQRVVRGQYIGEVGSTGVSTGPHLHLGVKVNGSYVNPEKGWLVIP